MNRDAETKTSVWKRGEPMESNGIDKVADELSNGGASIEIIDERPSQPAKSYKNVDMGQMIDSLEPFLERVDKIGYAAARNTRILINEAKEYLERREELLHKYGEPVIDENGNQTGTVRLMIGSPAFYEYRNEIEEWASIEHTPNIFKLKYDEAIGKLSGTQILEIDWMFED